MSNDGRIKLCPTMGVLMNCLHVGHDVMPLIGSSMEMWLQYLRGQGLSLALWAQLSIGLIGIKKMGYGWHVSLPSCIPS